MSTPKQQRTSLQEENLNFYNEYGYLVLENVFTAEQIQEIRDAIPQCENHKGIEKIYEEDGETIRSIMSYHDKVPALDKYTRAPRVLAAVSSLIGPDVYVSQSKINLKKGEEMGKKWDYHRGLTFWNTLDGIPEGRMISVFICLTDQTEENGAVYVLEKSHLGIGLPELKEESDITYNHKEDTAVNLSIQIKREKLDEYESAFVKKHLTAKAGDVLFMHPCLLHASENNKTAQSRDLMITVYNPTDNLPTKQDRPGYLNEPFKGAIKPYDEESEPVLSMS